MVDAHELVAKVKELAIDLGRVPTRPEFESYVRGAHRKLAQVGGYTVLLQQAGLETYHGSGPRARKIDKSVFQKDLEAHLSGYESDAPKPQEPYLRCLFIPDTHFPFVNQHVLDRIYRFAEREKPDIIVQLGDLFDCYSHAKFPRSHNVFTPRQEQEVARAGAETMWKELTKASPDSKRYQLMGNHDVRPLKRALEVYPAAEDWITRMVDELMTFDGVETMPDGRTELFLPGEVMVHHGYMTGIGKHRDKTLLNAVVGHTHLGGVSFRQIHGKVRWELNAGLAGDPNAKGLTYSNQRMTNWTPGFGFLDLDGPRFIAL